MEYVFYVLAVLALTALCLFFIRLPGRSRLRGRPIELSQRARKHRAKERRQHAQSSARADAQKRHGIVKRELRKAPVPWGWPGHGQDQSQVPPEENHSLAPLQHWIDHLRSEKRTVDDREYTSRRAASLRALLEDRYGRASTMSEMEYGKVKPPLLRDPNAPHDQMDNFPSGKTGRIVAGLSRQPPDTGTAVQSKMRRMEKNLKRIRKPWGW